MAYAPNLIRQIKAPDAKEVIKDALYSQYSNGRTALLNSNARMDGRVGDKEWEEYNKFVYMRWYNHFKNMSQDDIEKLLSQFNSDSVKQDGTKTSAADRVAEYRKIINDIRNSPKYNPEQIEKTTTFFRFLSDECTSENLRGFRPYKNQQESFFHIMELPTHEQSRGDTQFRLYLNISSKHITDVSKGLMGKCDQQKIPVYFKTSDRTNEADTIVIYTSYKEAQPLVEVLKQLKSERPELFIGAEKTAKSEGQIAGFIGCGEEPAYKHSSYNAERGEVVESLKGDFVLKNAKQVITPNFTSQGMITNSKGQSQSFMQYLAYKLQDIVTQNKAFQQKGIDVDFTSEENVALMRNFAIKTLRQIIDGTEGEKTSCSIVDKNGKSHSFYDLQFDLTPKLLEVFGYNKGKDPKVNKDELLEHLFKDKKMGGYSAFCFHALSQEVVDTANERIGTAKNGFVDGMSIPYKGGNHQIPVSTYQSIIKAVQQGTDKGKRLINKGVYNHILDLWEGNVEMNEYNRDPQKHKKPTSIGNSARIKFSKDSHIQDIYSSGFSTRMLSGYMQQQGIEPILPDESQMREECLKRDVSFDNFCLNESSMVKYREWEKKQLGNA